MALTADQHRQVIASIGAWRADQGAAVACPSCGKPDSRSSTARRGRMPMDASLRR